MFKSKDYMTLEQQNIADDFIEMIEEEYALYVENIKRAYNAAYTPFLEDVNYESERKTAFASSEITVIHKYWTNRLSALVELIENKDKKLNKELARNYDFIQYVIFYIFEFLKQDFIKYG